MEKWVPDKLILQQITTINSGKKIQKQLPAVVSSGELKLSKQSARNKFLVFFFIFVFGLFCGF